MTKILISLAALILVAGCSTPQSRARGQADLMESLTPEERALVEAGEVDLGFSEEMVLVALGEPDRKFSQRTEEGRSVVWIYDAGGALSRFSLGVGTGVSRGSRGSAYGGGVSVGTGGGRRVAEEKMRVIFEDGRVSAIERAEQ